MSLITGKLKRYPYVVLALVLLLGLGWRFAAAAGKNSLHLHLLGMVMGDEPGGTLPEVTDEVTGLTARAAAYLHPEEAQAWLEAGLSDDSHTLTALQLCLWYWEAGRRDDAAAACRQSQDSTIYWIRQGIAAQIAGDNTGAIAFFEMATQVEPESAEAWYRLGVLLQLERRYEEALVAFQAAVNHGYSAYDSLGGIYLQLKRYAEAREVLLEGIAVFPEVRYTYLNLALVAEAEEKWTEADDWYRQLAQLFPDYGPAYSGRGRMALHLGQYTQAVTYFQQATQMEPGRLGFWLDLGNAAAQSGDITIAIKAYQQALIMQPGNAQAQTGLEALVQK